MKAGCPRQEKERKDEGKMKHNKNNSKTNTYKHVEENISC